MSLNFDNVERLPSKFQIYHDFVVGNLKHQPDLKKDAKIVQVFDKFGLCMAPYIYSANRVLVLAPSKKKIKEYKDYFYFNSVYLEEGFLNHHSRGDFIEISADYPEEKNWDLYKLVFATCRNPGIEYYNTYDLIILVKF